MDWTTLLLSTGAAGLALYVWYAMTWLALPHHKGDFFSVPQRADVEGALRALDLKPGFYALPHMDDFDGTHSNPELIARMQEGPNVMLTVMRKGNPMDGMTMVRGLLVNLCEALLLALFYGGFAAHLDSLGLVLAAGAGFGFLFGFIHYATQSNWMHAPWRFCWTSTFDRTVGFALAALVLWGFGPAF